MILPMRSVNTKLTGIAQHYNVTTATIPLKDPGPIRMGSGGGGREIIAEEMVEVGG